MKYLVMLMLPLLFLCCSTNNHKQGKGNSLAESLHAKVEHSPVALDTVIERDVPLTLSGDKGILTYHLVVPSWNKPVLWTISLTIGADTLLHEVSHYDSLDDTALTWFVGSDSVLPLADLPAAKRQWYLSEILQYQLDTVTQGARADWIRISKAIARTYFPTRADTSIVDSFWKDYEDKDFLTVDFSFHTGPISNELQLSYYPKAKRLVPIYAP